MTSWTNKIYTNGNDLPYWSWSAPSFCWPSVESLVHSQESLVHPKRAASFPSPTCYFPSVDTVPQPLPGLILVSLLVWLVMKMADIGFSHKTSRGTTFFSRRANSLGEVWETNHTFTEGKDVEEAGNGVRRNLCLRWQPLLLACLRM